MKQCWCGSKNLLDFSEHYAKCSNCNTLINKGNIKATIDIVNNDDKDFYGKTYWTEHFTNDYNYPDFFSRIRLDIPERCTYWLKNILKYKLPPLKTLELGCGNGGLVFLMQNSGFDSTGTELSPWICEYNQKTFDINMLCGKIENLNVTDNTYDIIILMDVLEHFIDPSQILHLLAKKLKDDGMLVIQTPCYGGQTYSQLVKENNLFIQQLKEKEHTFLFNMENIKSLLELNGFNHVNFEKPLFPYDMFFFASKHELNQNEYEVIANNLTKDSKSRIVLALLDLYKENENLQEFKLEADKRLKDISLLTSKISDLQKSNEEILQESNKRLNDVTLLTSQLTNLQKSNEEILQESEKRLKDVILLTSQITNLQKFNEEISQESNKRLKDVLSLNELVHNMQTEFISIEETFKNKLSELENSKNSYKNELDLLNKNIIIRFIKKLTIREKGSKEK